MGIALKYDMAALRFSLQATSSTCAARLGQVTTPHGVFDTPAFMPVGTKGTVKGLLVDQVEDTGAQVILGNTYHLMIRPGAERVAKLGGLHGFSGWPHTILTDSGGFQVFSLANASTISEEGVRFKNDIDGAEVFLSPETSMAAQNALGADIIMAFDDCPPMPSDRVDPAAPAARHAVDPATYDARNRLAVDRTIRWMARCIEAHGRPDDQALFGIVQGGQDLDLRSHCARALVDMDLPGYAVGGVSVGERHDQIVRVVEHTTGILPKNKPRYLMGVGYERDIVMAVRAGIDMFDCVLPTRNGRNAKAFTRFGPLNMRNAIHADDPNPIETDCDCVTCGRHSRAYLRHLFVAGEMLGPVLLSIHNLRHYQRLMLDIRTAIREDDWSLLEARWPVLSAEAED